MLLLVVEGYYICPTFYEDTVNMDNRDAIIRTYFDRGYSYKEIQSVLAKKHKYTLSLVHLQRLITRMGLYRRMQHSPLQDLVDFIHNEVKHSGQQLGYRFMHMKCTRAGLHVSQKMVAEALRIIDPEGVELRKRRRVI